MPKRKQSKMEKAREIVREEYANSLPPSQGGTPRKNAIERLQKSPQAGGLGMKPTTAATYHAHCITYFREQEQEAALEKAESGKPVWTAYKTNGQGEITSCGVFLTKKAATQFNNEFYHDGVVKGVQEVGDTVTKPRKSRKAA